MGWMISGTFARRPFELQEMRRALEILETEMLYSASLLPSAMEKAGDLAGPPVARIFREAARLIRSGEGLTVREAWTYSIESAYRLTSLTPQDRQILLELGDCLGSSSRDDQERHLRRIQDYLATHEARARAEMDSYCRMWQYLGLSAGLILAILLY
ncbi:MAG TPA: stage III sporulation protein AB [Firmicutes bacterium]|nr:stage III sporulation protein AB [Bacillota bacterium]